MSIFDNLPAFQPPVLQDFSLQKNFGRDYVDTLVNTYIVQPKYSTGIGGFVFDYETDTRAELNADITDHYTEANYAIQDHIGIKPTRLTLRGFVAEVAFEPTAGLVGALNTLQNKLTTIPSFLGQYTPGILQRMQNVVTQSQNTVNQLDNTISRIKNVVGFFNAAAPGNTKQKQAYHKLQTLFAIRHPFSVVTPWWTFQNMVIERLVFTQEEGINTWSDIVVTLKEIRIATVQTAPINVNANRAVQSSQPLTNQGSGGATAKSGLLKGFEAAGFFTGPRP